MAQAMHAGACPSLHSFPPLTIFTPLPLVPRAAAHAPAVCKFLPSSPPPSSPPPPLPSFPPPLLTSFPSPRRFGPFHSLLAALDLPLVALFAPAARNNSLSFLPPLSPTFSFYFSLFFPSPSPRAACNARRLSNVLSRALRVATRCAFLFFAKERKEAASAQSASARAQSARAQSGCKT